MSRSSLGVLGALFDALQIRRVRVAYTGVSQRRSPETGLRGMAEEMRSGLAHLSEAERSEADRRVLETIFFGRIGMGVVGSAARRWPARTASLCARAAPRALRFLVGDVAYAAPDRDHLPDCRFRREGGEELCQRVCRVPTQTFCAKMGIPVALTPAAGSCACDWRWGAPEPQDHDEGAEHGSSADEASRRVSSFPP